ncbi:probable cytosol aminopeptidase [Rattus rattus]|uniref:probable cytosol aminopeptidase n=1 Tax=Rattus rattus TaxID=10117 RepID=UPI0013F2FFB8|nr:probable cytosol aminopeptidase [Rattus rattus]
MEIQRITFSSGKENAFRRVDDKNGVIELNTGEIGTSAELYEVIQKKLGEASEELSIDRDSFRQLEFGFGDKERDLALATLHLDSTFVSFSLKKKEDLEKEYRKWSLEGQDWDEEVSNILEGTRLTRKLQNTPPNLMMPENFVEEARKYLEGISGIEINVISGGDLKKEKLGLIEAVGGASEHAPRLLIVKYSAAGSKEYMALVGKGVCYDSGGLNIKTGSYMSKMKFDMSGAAVSLGVVGALARNKCKNSIVVAIPLVENAVGPKSYRADDVLISRNGMSVEIENTDAEGRLVLADALAYVADVYKPKEIMTIATLTGAIGYALGYKYAGAWSTEDDMSSRLLESSKQWGEWIWRMPLDDYYLKALKKTKVADIANSAKTGAGGSNRAAMFLKEFTNKLPYIHLDIANIDHCDKTGEPTAPLFKTIYFYMSGR